MRKKCEQCGKFCKRLNEIWQTSHMPSPDRQVCDSCYERSK